MNIVAVLTTVALAALQYITGPHAEVESFVNDDGLLVDVAPWTFYKDMTHVLPSVKTETPFTAGPLKNFIDNHLCVECHTPQSWMNRLHEEYRRKLQRWHHL